VITPLGETPRTASPMDSINVASSIARCSSVAFPAAGEVVAVRDLRTTPARRSALRVPDHDTA
jgi:hypothetical protein